jgi:hypothetical protein
MVPTVITFQSNFFFQFGYDCQLFLLCYVNLSFKKVFFVFFSLLIVVNVFAFSCYHFNRLVITANGFFVILIKICNFVFQLVIIVTTWEDTNGPPDVVVDAISAFSESAGTINFDKNEGEVRLGEVRLG